MRTGPEEYPQLAGGLHTCTVCHSRRTAIPKNLERGIRNEHPEPHEAANTVGYDIVGHPDCNGNGIMLHCWLFLSKKNKLHQKESQVI